MSATGSQIHFDIGQSIVLLLDQTLSYVFSRRISGSDLLVVALLLYISGVWTVKSIEFKILLIILAQRD